MCGIIWTDRSEHSILQCIVRARVHTREFDGNFVCANVQPRRVCFSILVRLFSLLMPNALERYDMLRCACCVPLINFYLAFTLARLFRNPLPSHHTRGKRSFENIFTWNETFSKYERMNARMPKNDKKKSEYWPSTRPTC